MSSVDVIRRQFQDRRCFFIYCLALLDKLNNTMYTALYLSHLPAIPKELIKYSLDMEQFYHGGPRGRRLIRNDCEFESGLNRRQELNPELEDWLRKNIITDWNDVGYSRTTPPCHGPHLDRSRFFTLQYVIEPGGENVATVFYRSRNQKLDMDDKFWINNYDQIEPIDHQFIPPGVWVLINARNHIHSVENISSVRVSVQIGLMKDPVDDVFAKVGVIPGH